MSSTKRPATETIDTQDHAEKKQRSAEQIKPENVTEKAVLKFPSLEAFRIVEEANRAGRRGQASGSEPQIQALRTQLSNHERSTLDEIESLRKSFELQIQAIKSSILQNALDFKDEVSKQTGDVRDHLRQTGSNLDSMITTQIDQVNRTFDRKIQNVNNNSTAHENRIVDIESRLDSLTSLHARIGNIIESKVEDVIKQRFREFESKLNREMQPFKSALSSLETKVDHNLQETLYNRQAIAKMQSFMKDMNAASPQPLSHIDFLVPKRDPQAEI